MRTANSSCFILRTIKHWDEFIADPPQSDYLRAASIKNIILNVKALELKAALVVIKRNEVNNLINSH